MGSDTAIESLKQGFEGELRINEPLSKHTYYRIGGEAKVLAVPRSREDLKKIVQFLNQTKLPFFILGKGSNVLVSDQGFDGVVMKTSRMNNQIECHDDQIEVGASVVVSNLLRKAGEKGWDGFEFLTGVPGSMGGVVWMNAGTHLGEAKDLLLKVETLKFSVDSGECERVCYEKDQLEYSYRKNHFLSEHEIVWNTVWELKSGDPDVVKNKIQEVLDRRKATQPIDHPSCGSVFKNPKSSGLHAWQVIDQLKLRGHQIGGACFSEKHCNFILNLGGAKAQDVKALIELAKNRALDEQGVSLEEEVRYLGFDSD